MNWNRAEVPTLEALEGVISRIEVETREAGAMNVAPLSAKVFFAPSDNGLVVYFTDEAAVQWRALRELQATPCESPL